MRHITTIHGRTVIPDGYLTGQIQMSRQIRVEDLPVHLKDAGFSLAVNLSVVIRLIKEMIFLLLPPPVE